MVVFRNEEEELKISFLSILLIPPSPFCFYMYCIYNIVWVSGPPCKKRDLPLSLFNSKERIMNPSGPTLSFVLYMYMINENKMVPSLHLSLSVCIFISKKAQKESSTWAPSSPFLGNFLFFIIFVLFFFTFYFFVDKKCEEGEGSRG